MQCEISSWREEIPAVQKMVLVFRPKKNEKENKYDKNNFFYMFLKRGKDDNFLFLFFFFFAINDIFRPV